MENTQNKNMMMWLPLIVVCIAQVGTSGDNSVLSMSTNEFISKLGASMDQVQLANIVYSLLAGALMVFGGMLGIAKGFKRIFMTGAALCAVGEALAVIAPNMVILIWGARSMTGLGAALMIPSVLGIIVSLYEGKERAVAFGGVGAATGFAAVIMPIGAGLIIDLSGYQAAFSTMSIWFVAVFIAAWKIIPNIKPAQMRVDYIGTVIASLGLLAFIIGCSKISVWGLIEPMDTPMTVFGISPALPLALLGIVIMFVTMKIEKGIEEKHGAALIPQSFIHTRQVRNGLYVTGLIFAVFGAAFFVTLSWIMVVAGKGGIETGLSMAVMAGPMIILSLGIPKKASHLSPRMVVLVSTGLVILGAILMLNSLLPDGFEPIQMYLGLALLGAGQGGYASQSAMIVASALNPRDAAQSGGIQCSTRNVWQAAGVAIIGAVLLFSSTAIFKNQIERSTVSSVVKEYVAQTPVHGFMANDAMTEKLKNIGAIDEDIEHALTIYKATRIESAQWAFWSLVLFVALHIPGFMGIPTQGWTSKKSVEKTVSSKA
ncbi:MFS transporter [Photobacterium damselae]|uniref:MFS transporter n=1 Tax=Photobacterium damselae TaxID=38293 RepID=UPI001EFC67CB|nr:MFS transporter [Photobacterium damselae]MCG9706701.1 MFS transporter [Photobacterium damselae]